MAALLLQPSPDVSRSHWTVPVTREETLTIREKFRKVGWRKPNYKPNTTKVIEGAKNLWNRYVARGDLFYQHVVRVRVSDVVFSGTACILALIPTNTCSIAGLPTLKPGLTGSTVQPRRKRTKPSSSCGNGCANPTASWP
jgi:hypothetical protein